MRFVTPPSLEPEIDDPTISELRRKIDALDQRLLALIAERLEIVHEVGEEKRKKGLRVFDPAREELLLLRLIQTAPAPLDEQAVRNMFAAIVRECRRLESQKIDDEQRGA